MFENQCQFRMSIQNVSSECRFQMWCLKHVWTQRTLTDETQKTSCCGQDQQSQCSGVHGWHPQCHTERLEMMHLATCNGMRLILKDREQKPRISVTIHMFIDVHYIEIIFDLNKPNKPSVVKVGHPTLTQASCFPQIFILSPGRSGHGRAEGHGATSQS